MSEKPFESHDPVPADPGEPDLYRTSGPHPSPDQLRKGAAFESTPLTRPEYLSVMVHFYRAEVHRSTIWRVRLDATTNWAALTAAGMLSWAFAEPSHSHVMLLLINVIVYVYMVIEARRYRRFEVYWARVRMLEENFISPVVSRELESPRSHWREEIAEDMLRPTYKSELLAAIGFRLRRNYVYIFGIILGAWVVKLGLHPVVAPSMAALYERMAVGYIPPSVVLITGLIFYSWLGYIWTRGSRIHGAGAPTDEIIGVEQNPERWKF